MYISPREVADTRDHTLHNLLTASTACVDAGERLTSLFMGASRDAITHGSRQLGILVSGGNPLAAPAEFWIAGLQNGPAQLFEAAFDILGATHTAMVQAADAQIRVCDQILVTAIDRAAQSSPWEGEVALAVMKTSLQSTESTLHCLANAVIQTVELAENRVRQVAGSTGNDNTAKPASRQPRSRKAQ